ncbi:hypothetical protein J6590_029322 [Homalodisca vitripennis]|nr:hypothetical protein J6590_029322 [Homalodisca vitripennis]
MKRPTVRETLTDPDHSLSYMGASKRLCHHRVTSSRELMRLYENDSEDLMGRLLTRDKTYQNLIPSIYPCSGGLLTCESEHRELPRRSGRVPKNLNAYGIEGSE